MSVLALRPLHRGRPAATGDGLGASEAERPVRLVLGGLVAVKNVDEPDDVAWESLVVAQTLFPQVAWARKRWATLRIDRAEPSVSTGWLPDGPSVMRHENCFVAWPTKLTFAPAIARESARTFSRHAAGPREEITGTDSRRRQSAAIPGKTPNGAE